MRFLFLAFFFVWLPFAAAFSQAFEWAAGGSFADLAYRFGTTDAAGNLVVAGKLDYSTIPQEAPIIHDAAGEGVALDLWGYRNGSEVMVSYSPEGKINWLKEYHAPLATLAGMAADKTGNIYLLQEIHAATRDDRGILVLKDRNTEVAPGLYLICLNQKGQLQWHRKVLDELWPQTELSGFIMHPDGGFVVGGAVWSAAKIPGLGFDFGEHGGFFLLRLTTEGKITWHQTIRNLNYRGTRLANTNVALAVNPRGTIFMAFNHLEGIAISEKERSPEYPPPANQRLSPPSKAVLAAYSPKGKRLWVRYSGENVSAYALATNKNLVFQSIRTNQPTPYGLPADTSAEKKAGLVAFKRSGKPAWVKTMAADKADALATDTHGDLYLFGTLREIGGVRRSRAAQIGTDTLAKGYIFFAGFSAKGVYRGVLTSNVMVHTREVNLGLFRDQHDNFYGTGYMHYGLPTPFTRWDKAFGGGETHGGSPLVGRLKKPVR